MSGHNPRHAPGKLFGYRLSARERTQIYRRAPAIPEAADICEWETGVPRVKEVGTGRYKTAESKAAPETRMGAPVWRLGLDRSNQAYPTALPCESCDPNQAGDIMHVRWRRD